MEVTNSTAIVHLVPLPMTFATLSLSLFGVFGNMLIVIAAVISKSLQSRCQILIAMLAGGDAIVCIYLVQLRVMMLQGFYFVSNIDCFTISIHGLFALNVQAAMGLFLGIDRLLAVSVPLKYNKISIWLYVFLFLLVLVYAVLLTGNGYLDIKKEIVPVCLPPTAYSENSRMVWVASSFVVAIVVLVVYATAHVQCQRMKRNNTHEPSVKKVERLLNSLSIVVGVYFFTWFLTVVALLASQLLTMSAGLQATINQQLAWLVIINSSTNFLIYFWRSPEYRKAFLFIVTAGVAPHPNSPSPSTIINRGTTQELFRRRSSSQNTSSIRS